MRSKLVPLLCYVALATCHLSSANVWQQSTVPQTQYQSQEQPTIPGQSQVQGVETEGANAFFPNYQAGLDYFQQPINEQIQSVSVSSTGVVSEPTYQHLSVPDATNHGTKGGGLKGFFARNKAKKQQQTNLQATMFNVDHSLENAGGYLEIQPVPATTTGNTVNTTGSKGRGRFFAKLLPWNWFYTSTQRVESDVPTVGKAINIFPNGQPSILLNPPKQYCYCVPYGATPVYPSVPSVGEDAQAGQPGQVVSNVQPVPASNDHSAFESKKIVSIVPPPQQQGQQLPSSLTQQVPQVEQGSSTGVNEQSNGVQQVTSQQQQQVPYIFQTSGGTYANNANQQSNPVSTNYHSTAGEVAQTGQVSGN